MLDRRERGGLREPVHRERDGVLSMIGDHVAGGRPRSRDAGRRGRAPSTSSASPARSGTPGPARAPGRRTPGRGTRGTPRRRPRSPSLGEPASNRADLLRRQRRCRSGCSAWRAATFGPRGDRADERVDVVPEVGRERHGDRTGSASGVYTGYTSNERHGYSASSPGSRYVSATCCSSPTDPLPTVDLLDLAHRASGQRLAQRSGPVVGVAVERRWPPRSRRPRSARSAGSGSRSTRA